MSRVVTIAAAQMGPIARSENRAAVVRRLIDLMRQAKAMGAEVVAYPEATITAFFSHWFTDDEEEEMNGRVKKILNDALERADESPQPDPATLLEGVYATPEDLDTPHHK